MATTCLQPAEIGGVQIGFLTTGLVPYQWPTIGPGGAAMVVWPAPVDPDSGDGPNMGDHVLVSMDCDLQGMTIEGYVQTVGTLVAVIKNPSGAPITLALANIRFTVLTFLAVT